MADASREEITKALALWSVAQQGKTPQEWQGFISKYNLQDPFDPWPPTKERIDIFLRRFQETILTNTEAKINISKTISTQKLDELVDEFNREYDSKVKVAHNTADARAQKYVRDAQERIRLTIEKTNVDPEQKNLLFREMTVKMTDDPAMTITEAEAGAVSVLEKAQPFFLKEEDVKSLLIKEPPSFSKLQGRNIIQKALSPVGDALITVFPELRQGVLNKNLEAELRKILDAPNALMDKLGIKAVDQLAFKQVIHNAQTGISQSPSPGGAASFLDGLASNIFHTSFTATAEQSVVTYWQAVNASLIQGGTIPSANQFMASGMGIGSEMFHLGANYAFSKAKGAAFKGMATKLGLELGAEAAIPGIGWAAGLITAGAALLGGIGNWLKRQVGLGEGGVPGDNWIMGIGCGAILLIFFILPMTAQMAIDTSLISHLEVPEGGPGQAAQLMDITITATPTSAGGAITSIQYTITVKPKGSPASFKINNVNVTFSVYAAVGNPTLSAPAITPDMLQNGSYTFTVPVGPQFNNSNITATVNANADVGSVTDINGSSSVSTLDGNAPGDCFVFGGGGTRDGYGHTSSAWDSTGAMTAAIGTLEKSKAYISKICSGGPITLYRVNANFGGGSTSPPNSIFMYNACATTACATYTLAHESGHILDSRTGLFSQYENLGLYAREGPLWTYPNAFSEHEDFAETMGAYVVWHNYTWGARHGHAGGNLNYAGQYPLHYEFAKEVFGGIEY